MPRGSLIGPLVIAGVAVERGSLDLLVRSGVKDSKDLSKERRERLYSSIIRVANILKVVLIEPRQVDEFVKDNRLNRLEANCMAKIIDFLRPSEVFIDSPSVKPDKFKKEIEDKISVKTKVITANKADKLYPIVGAAAIIAKVNRDRYVESLKQHYGDFGSGYPADPRTLNFIKKLIREGRDIPPIVRKTWETLKRVPQFKLTDFSEG